MLSPPLSPPGVVPRGPQRNMAKTAALKLVTTFGENSTKSKFFGADDRTPINGMGVTPIAESALSPSGGDQTAFLRAPHGRSAYNTPASARTATPGGFTRQRLPSIGEMPTDVTPQMRKAAATLSGDTSSNMSKEEQLDRGHTRKSSQPETLQLTAGVFQPSSRAATASPMLQRAHTDKTANVLPPPSPEKFSRTKQESRYRNGSRDRKPDGLQIQWPPMESIITGDYMTTPELSAASSRHRTPTARSVTGSVTGSVSSVSSSGRRSPMVSERSYRSRGVASPITGRSLDQYISSLDAAQHAKAHQRARPTTREQDDRSRRGRSSSRKGKAREPSEDRGRSGARYIKPAKRSPTSPVPMSPDELREIGVMTFDDGQSESGSNISGIRRKVRDASAATTVKPGSKATSRVRRSSPEPLRLETGSRPASRTTARIASRRTSPEPPADSLTGRGRSKARDGSLMRSPSSPLPMSPESKLYTRDDGDDLKAALEDRERFRTRQRSVSRVRERGTSSVRHVSPERKRRDRSTSRVGRGQDGADAREEPRRAHRAASHTRSVSDLKAGDLHQIKADRQRKKEAAAKELEERRRSLARRPSAPPIMHPEELSPMVFRPASRGFETTTSSTFPSPGQLPPRSQTVQPESMRPTESSRSSFVQIGLPATPRAMQHPKYDPDNKDIPDVPQIPESYNSGTIMMGSLDEITNNDTYDLGTLPQTTFAPLPKTTYQVAPRHIPPRSMSAPIPEEPPVSPHALPAALPTHPAFQAALPPSSRRRNHEGATDERSYTHASRKINPGESQPGTIGYEARNIVPVYSAVPFMGGIDETIVASQTMHNPNDNLIPPPPPPAPAPPILRELQHLVVPPPPPPAPLYRMHSNSQPPPPPAVIEIVMDDETTVVPVRTTPPQTLDAPRPGSVSHNRGRSQNDNSIGGRFSRATERIRSASRGASPQLSRTKSPAISAPMGPAPYESVPTANWVADQIQQRAAHLAAPNTERHPREVRAEMMEGGMI